MTTAAQRELESLKDPADAANDTARAWSLFKLEARSDSASMGNLRLEDAQKLYVDGIGGQPVGATNAPYRAFLLGDVGVPAGSNYESGLIKAVAVE